MSGFSTTPAGSSLAQSGDGTFSLADVHARSETYDDVSSGAADAGGGGGDPFSFKRAAPRTRTDPRLFSLPAGSGRAAQSLAPASMGQA